MAGTNRLSEFSTLLAEADNWHWPISRNALASGLLLVLPPNRTLARNGTYFSGTAQAVRSKRSQTCQKPGGSRRSATLESLK